ncbi:MAG: 50S ribosomal protein L9 [Anaerolineales bacterium]
MLLKDVYNLGRAGDVKRVANGYGRNFLIPQGLATMATPGALTQSDRIRTAAEEERARLNHELTAVFKQLNGLQLNFPVKAGETGKLYGSVTTQMISETIMEIKGIELDRSQIVSEPIRSLGVHPVSIRLTVDLISELTVVVHREDLPPESAFEQVVEEVEDTEEFADLQAELEAEEAEAEAAEGDEQPEEEDDQAAEGDEQPEEEDEQAAVGDEQAEQKDRQAAVGDEQPELEGEQAAEAEEQSEEEQPEQEELVDEGAGEDIPGEESDVDPIASEEEVEQS